MSERVVMCSVCGWREATRPYPARRPHPVCDECADDIYAAMEAHWEYIARRLEDA